MDIDCRSENSGQPFRKPRATLVSRLLCPFLLRKHFGQDYRGRHSFQKLENMGIRSEREPLLGALLFASVHRVQPPMKPVFSEL